MDVIDTFTTAEKRLFRRLAGAIISASESRNIPGADDEKIFAKLLSRAERDNKLRAAMADFFAQFGGIETVANLDDAPFKELMEVVGKKQHRFLMATLTLLAQTYYQDPRVLRALNIEGSPPFPRGNELEQGDWSLLDPVKSMAPIFRQC